VRLGNNSVGLLLSASGVFAPWALRSATSKLELRPRGGIVEKQQSMKPSAQRSRKASGSTTNGMASRPVDQARIEAAVREILLAVGEDPDREGLLETPERVARMYGELFSG